MSRLVGAFSPAHGAGETSAVVSVTMRTSVSCSVNVALVCIVPVRFVTRQLMRWRRSPGRNARTSDSAVPSPRRRERCAPLTPIGVGTSTGASSTTEAGTTCRDDEGSVTCAR